VGFVVVHHLVFGLRFSMMRFPRFIPANVHVFTFSDAYGPNVIWIFIYTFYKVFWHDISSI